MSDQAASTTAPLGRYPAKVQMMRETAKWVITLFTGLGAVLIAGTPYAALGKLDPSADLPRLWAAVLGCGIAFISIASIIWAATRVMLCGEVTLDELAQLEVQAETKGSEDAEIAWLKRHKLLGYFDSITVLQSRQEAVRAELAPLVTRDPRPPLPAGADGDAQPPALVPALNRWLAQHVLGATAIGRAQAPAPAESPESAAGTTPAAPSDARVEQLAPVAEALSATATAITAGAHCYRVEQEFRRTRYIMFWAGGAAVVGATLFVCAVNRPDATPPAGAGSFVTPAAGQMALFAPAREALAGALGPACVAAPTVPVVVVAATPESFDVVTVPSDVCRPARVRLTSSMGTVLAATAVQLPMTASGTPSK